MSVVTEKMPETMADETMTDANALTVSKTVQQLGNDRIINLSERIVGTQTLLDLHSTMRANYEKELRKFNRTANTSLDKGMTSLDKGMTAVQASLAHMDKSLQIHRKFVEETEEIAKFAREQLELLEERQAAYREMVESA